MTSKNESTLTNEESNVIQSLRDRGFYILMYTPEQVGKTDIGTLEETLTSAADFIFDVKHN